MAIEQFVVKSPRQALLELLANMFSSEELRRLMRYGPHTAAIIPDLPGEGVSMLTLCDAVVSQLEQHALIDAQFFEQLASERPRRRDEIAVVASLWEMSTPLRALEADEADEADEPVLPGAITSFKLRLAVEASDSERALRVDEYAAALATVLARSDGGVCFGVFGPWGRGKSFLMRRVTALLPQMSRLPYRYEVVWFSAWKYPSVPEVWVHLYETLANHAHRGSRLRGARRAIRSNIERHGIIPGVLVLLSAALAMLPLTAYVELVWYLVATLGLSGMFALIRISRAVLNPAGHLKRQYLSRVSHTEKLGLQAVIGEDLRALVNGWLREPTADRLARTQLSVTLMVVGVVGFALWTSLGSLAPAIPGVQFLVSGLWILFAGVVAVWLALPPRDCDRVLLVVDDLDRCRLDHLCEVIESLKLMTEAPELGGRIQVAALVEEEAIEWAIGRRFKERSSSNTGNATHMASRLVQEHLQKLFLGHLRLPDLSESDFEELFTKYLVAGESPLAPARANPMPARRPATGPAASASPAPGSSFIETAIDVAGSQVLFEPDERAALLRCIPKLRRLHPHCGPRQLRSFLFRYQLGRLLLRIQGRADVAPESLFRALIGASISPADPQLEAVVRMIR